MKHLIIVRHAKANRQNPGLDDHDIPLSDPGKQAATEMAQRLSKKIDTPELILTSTANRALTTATLMAQELGVHEEDLITVNDMYTVDTTRMLEVIQHIDDDINRVVMVGHNPGMTKLVNWLADTSIEDMPTCGIVILGYEMDSWSMIDDLTGQLIDYFYPDNGS